MKPNKGFCRLNVILATEAPIGVIFRRGPTNWVQLIKWETDSDTFTPGQWFRGRIYTERCDLSPDGSKLVYFAAKYHRWATIGGSSYWESWTAISKLPYFTALALWNDVGTYGGGGYFENDLTVCLGRVQVEPHPNHVPPSWFRVKPANMPVDHFWRMQQNGWKVISLGGKFKEGGRYISVYETPVICQKDSQDGNYRLTMELTGFNYKKYGGITLITYSLKRLKDSELLLLNDTWADWDQQHRLVYAEAGKLYSAKIEPNGITPTLLADFNLNKPELIQSPDWAKTWD